MSFPSAFRLRDYKLFAKKAAKSGWATGTQEIPPLKSHGECHVFEIVGEVGG